MQIDSDVYITNTVIFSPPLIFPMSYKLIIHQV